MFNEHFSGFPSATLITDTKEMPVSNRCLFENPGLIFKDSWYMHYYYAYMYMYIATNLCFRPSH